MKSSLALFILLSLFALGCRNRVPNSSTAQASSTGQKATFKPTAHPYRPSETRHFDLLNTRLEVSFDWEKQQMPGRATLTMRPWFHPSDRVTLDAKGFIIHKVARQDGPQQTELRYNYDLRQLEVFLDRPYTRNETFDLYIEYTARPAALDTLLDEAAAEEQGLYFVNPLNDIPGKPQQIWTQGETHGSSGWFPTFDQPNERCTQEMYITVADTFVTLSNGLLLGSQYNDDGTRTDHWKMSQPHAPYLFMMAVGKFSITKDQWRGKEVSYYVEPEYGPYASLIFGNTPEMMEFFSNKLGVPYPWEKYSQIVVRDFVSGAMENTTATIHFSALQHDAREHLDETQEDFISHELFHQWFGDLVTCESWANLTLNEGFATYGEYLWREYKYGRDDADEHLFYDLQAYLGEATYKRENLIRYHHATPDDMFDGHSYQKGGLVLHMLRYYLGDPVFFEALKRYLTAHAYTDVEAAELRMAFEDVSGEDLNWFFDQWYFDRGHPELEIKHTWKDSTWRVEVHQVQDLPKYRVFRFPVRLELVEGREHTTFDVWMQSRDTVFVLPAPTQPDNVVFDADKVLLAAIKKEEKPLSAWTAQLQSGNGYAQKNQAMTQLEIAGPDAAAYTAIQQALHDKFWGTRSRALELLSMAPSETAEQAVPAVLALLHDPKAAVRSAALGFFWEQNMVGSTQLTPQDLTTIIAAFETAAGDSSYDVQETALRVLYQYAPESALKRVKSLLPTASPNITHVLAEILVQAEDPVALEVAAQNIRPDKAMPTRVGMVRVLGPALSQPKLRTEALRLLMEVAEKDANWWVRYAAARNLEDELEDANVKAFFERRAQVEEAENLKKYYQKAIAN